MPEVHFTIRWPDGMEEKCYSPSTAIQNHLQVGETYPVPEFLQHVRAGLHEASERVAAKYGFTCSSALDQLAKIEETATRQAAEGQVACISFS
ncbi:MSMEG_0570 family nitrogen starvation response protein [Agrobacterium tumefaciens]|jgi:uncharacterized repeat protein (TIGR04042 family)|uniref:MSMEG_0570 family nitrogen starvation response protein n=2 Tax=Rhizobium/Agrobacterium group TaxID=227290 RepID=A0AAF0KFZ4_AGRTU|nr:MULTISPECIES: MSMEG_0570 family nitrogen starvation response protein [Agrobacterium]WGM61091.1 MSMEG_0570 family nitrogen starvation response protein [Agrobacterium tumefaciens]